MAAPEALDLELFQKPPPSWRKVHLVDPLWRSNSCESVSPGAANLVEALAENFLHSATNLVATIQAPSQSGSDNRFNGSITLNQSQPLGGSPVRTEILRFRSPVHGPLLLHHILVMPQGQPVSATVVGATNPAPTACRLEVWASNLVLGLTSAIKPIEKCAHDFVCSGQMHKLVKTSGFVPNSVEFVPPYQKLDRTVNFDSSELGEDKAKFRQMIVTDTIVIRGVYHKLTLCVFGAHLGECGALISRAADRLWRSCVSKKVESELHLVSKHSKENQHGCVDDNEDPPIYEDSTAGATCVIASNIRDALSVLDDSMGEPSQDSQCRCNMAELNEFGDVMQRLVEGWKHLKQDGGAAFAVNYDRLSSLKTNWECVCKDKWLPRVAELVTDALYPVILLTSGLEETQEGDRGSRVVTMFENEETTDSDKRLATPGDSSVNSKSSPGRNSMERYWTASTPLKVCALEVGLAFSRTKHRARTLAIKHELAGMLVDALSKNVCSARQHRIAIVRLLLRLLAQDPTLATDLKPQLSIVESLLQSGFWQKQTRTDTVDTGDGSCYSAVVAQESWLAVPSQTPIQNTVAEVGLSCCLKTVRLYESCTCLVERLKFADDASAVSIHDVIQLDSQLRHLKSDFEALSVEKIEHGDQEEIEAYRHMEVDTQGALKRGVLDDYLLLERPQPLHDHSKLMYPCHLCPSLQQNVKNVLVESGLIEALVSVCVLDTQTECVDFKRMQTEARGLLSFLIWDCYGGHDLISDTQVMELALFVGSDHRVFRVAQLLLPLKRGLNLDYMSLLTTSAVGRQAFLIGLERFQDLWREIVQGFGVGFEKTDETPYVSVDTPGTNDVVKVVYLSRILFDLARYELPRFEIWLANHLKISEALQICQGRIKQFTSENFTTALFQVFKYVTAKQSLSKLSSAFLPELASHIPCPWMTSSVKPAINYLSGDADSLQEADRRGYECLMMAGFEEGSSIPLLDTTKPFRFVTQTSIASQQVDIDPDPSKEELQIYVAIQNHLLPWYMSLLLRLRVATKVIPVFGGNIEAFNADDYNLILNERIYRLLLKFVKRNLVLVSRDLFMDQYDMKPTSLDQERQVHEAIIESDQLKALLFNSLSFIKAVLLAPDRNMTLPSSRGVSVTAANTPSPDTLTKQGPLQYIDKTLLRSLFLLSSRCLQRALMGSAEYKALSQNVNNVIGEWFDLSDEMARRWIFKETLKYCCGVPILNYTRLHILKRLGSKAFEILSNARSGLSFAITHSTHPPQVFPVHLSTCDMNALEAQMEMSVHTMAVTLSIPSKVVTDPQKFHIRGEELEYICCSIPLANFAAADDRHINLLQTQDVFSKSLFPTERPDGTRRGSFDMSDLKAETPTWDLVYGKLVRKLKDNVPTLDWVLLTECTLEFAVVVEFLDSCVLVASASNSQSLVQLFFFLLPDIIRSGLPILPLLSHRLSYVSSQLSADTLNTTLCQLTKLCLTISLLPSILPSLISQHDTQWTTNSLTSVSTVLKALAELGQEVTKSTVLPRLVKASIKMFLALLKSIRSNRQSNLAFTVLTHTHGILRDILHLINLSLAKSEAGKSAHSLIESTFDLLEVCFGCSFVRVLMSAEMPHHSLDTASQMIFASEPSRALSLTGTISPVGDLSGAINFINDSCEQGERQRRATQLLSLIRQAFDCHLPKEFILHFFSVNPQTVAEDVGNLLASSNDETPLQKLMSELADGTEWERFYRILKDPNEQTPSIVSRNGVTSSAFWEAAEFVAEPQITQEDLIKFVNEEFCFDEAVHVDHPSLLELNPTKSLLTHRVIWKRGKEEITSLDHDVPLPLSIEMESYEDPESPLPAGSDPTRQKRSISAKAAKYSEQQHTQPVDDMSMTPAYPDDAASVRPIAALDDWSTFTSQAAMFNPPRQQHPQVMTLSRPVAVPNIKTDSDPQPSLENSLLSDPEYMELLAAGERSGLDVMAVFKNPSILTTDETVRERFLMLLQAFPNIHQAFLSCLT